MKIIDKLFVDVSFRRDKQSRLLYAPFGVFSRKSYVVDNAIVEANIRTYLRLNIVVVIIYMLSWILFEFYTPIFLLGGCVLSVVSIMISNRLTKDLKFIESPRSDFIASLGWARIMVIALSSFLMALLCALFVIVGWNKGDMTHLEMLVWVVSGTAFSAGAGAVLWIKIKRKD